MLSGPGADAPAIASGEIEDTEEQSKPNEAAGGRVASHVADA